MNGLRKKVRIQKGKIWGWEIRHDEDLKYGEVRVTDVRDTGSWGR